MFSPQAPKPADRQFLLPWMKGILALPTHEHARNELARIAHDVPAVARLRMTAQGPVHHAEGPHVEAHVERMLSVLYAVSEGTSMLLDVEEFAREKEFALEFKSIEETLRVHKDFFVAYSLAHDLGKDEALSFESIGGKAGEKERYTENATEPERVRYDKMYRAFATKFPSATIEETTAKFFDETGIITHFKGHARIGSSAEFAKIRESILFECNVPIVHAKLLTELIRLHMDVIETFEKSADAPAFSAFGAIVVRAGLNKEMFLDVAAAALFLDAVVGSLHYENGKFSHDYKSLLNFFKAEREVESGRHLLREEIEHRKAKTLVKELLVQGGCDPESIFELLKTPIGPVRGTVMHTVYDLIRDPESRVDFGASTDELRQRARKTQALFKERGIPFTL